MWRLLFASILALALALPASATTINLAPCYQLTFTAITPTAPGMYVVEGTESNLCPNPFFGVPEPQPVSGTAVLSADGSWVLRVLVPYFTAPIERLIVLLPDGTGTHGMVQGAVSLQ